MTREELIYEVCPYKSMIDCHSEEPYTHFKCKDCSILMNNWFDEYDKQIRADAIDEFAKKLIQTVTSMTTGFRVVGNIERIAKELKEQNK